MLRMLIYKITNMDKPFVITGLSGLTTAIIFTLVITSGQYNQAINVFIIMIASLSFFIGMFLKTKNKIVQALVGFGFSLILSSIILVFAVSNI